MWVRYHWVAVEVCADRTVVYDSATSKAVQDDAKKYCKCLHLPTPEFPEFHNRS